MPSEVPIVVGVPQAISAGGIHRSPQVPLGIQVKYDQPGPGTVSSPGRPAIAEPLHLALARAISSGDVSAPEGMVDADVIPAISQAISCLDPTGRVRICGQVKMLSLAECESLQDRSVSFCLAQFCNLTALTLNNCSLLTDTCLGCIAKSCPCLEKLSLSGCTAITDCGIELMLPMKKLAHLDVSKCSLLSDVTIEHLHQLNSLAGLNVSLCPALTLTSLTRLCALGQRSLAVRCTSLNAAGSGMCDEAMDGLLRAVQSSDCKSLTWLNVSRCRVGDEATRALLCACPNLRAVYLSMVPLTDLTLAGIAAACPLLREVHMTGCAMISDEGVHRIAVGCPQLRTVSLTGCGGLTDIGITSLATSCQHLSQLYAQGCCGVGSASVLALGKGCPCLTLLDLRGCSAISASSVEQLHALLPNCRVLVNAQLHSVW